MDISVMSLLPHGFTYLTRDLSLACIVSCGQYQHGLCHLNINKDITLCYRTFGNSDYSVCITFSQLPAKMHCADFSDAVYFRQGTTT